MNIDVKGIVVIAGNYGSGKSEVAINLALHQKNAGLSVSIADLDLVNPYFRTREVLKPLEKAGIKVVLPDLKYLNADLPILSPAVADMIKTTTDIAILDAGGDDVGVTVLAALSESLSLKNVSMIQVVNPFRPFTQNIEGCIKIKEEIEKSSKLKMTGIVGNTNLIDETTPEIIYQGFKMIQEFSNSTGLKIEFITAAANILDQLDKSNFNCPILQINRGLVPPWKKSSL